MSDQENKQAKQDLPADPAEQSKPAPKLRAVKAGSKAESREATRKTSSYSSEDYSATN